jgi:hypothetical protein
MCLHRGLGIRRARRAAGGRGCDRIREQAPKVSTLTRAGADAVTTRLSEISAALRAAPRPQACKL